MTDNFLNNILSIRKENISPEVWHQAQRVLIDYLCVTIAGAKVFREKELAYLDSLCEDGDTTIFGLNRKASMQTAALINGMSAHVIELDDGHRVGMLHLGAPVISAMLAVAEKENLSVKDFLLGVIVGYEVAIRLACAVQPGCKLRGYHATGTCGTVGVAMAIAAALHFDEEQMKSAFSAAVTSAAGVLEMIEGDTELKPYNAGRAAMDGLTAAYVGKARFKAPEDALGGKRGFLKIMTDEAKLNYLTDFQEGQYMIEKIYQKPYAACRHCHAPIEAALAIRPVMKNNAVASIMVETYKLAVAGHEHTKIEGVNSAKMSIPYSVAAALLLGQGDIDAFTADNVSNADILALATKVSVVEREDLTVLCPQKRAAIVTVTMADGTQHTHRVDYPKGEPENPLTNEELSQKFMSLAMFGGVKWETCEWVRQQILHEDFDVKAVLTAINKDII